MFSKQFSDYKTTTCSNAGPLSVFAEFKVPEVIRVSI